MVVVVLDHNLRVLMSQNMFMVVYVEIISQLGEITFNDFTKIPLKFEIFIDVKYF